MKPSIGRIVHYRLTKDEADRVNRRRSDARLTLEARSALRSGWQAHKGNPVSEGEVVAMTIVAVWPNEFGDHDGVNGQAILDGSDSLWVTSVKEGEGPGTWCWPPRVD